MGVDALGTSLTPRHMHEFSLLNGRKEGCLDIAKAPPSDSSVPRTRSRLHGRPGGPEEQNGKLPS